MLSYWQNTFIFPFPVLTKPHDTATHSLCLERAEVNDYKWLREVIIKNSKKKIKAPNAAIFCNLVVVVY